jgi:hypothetical protein
MPFFPRVLIHLVGLDRLVVQGQRVGCLQRLVLEPVPELQEVLAVPVQLPGQPGGGLALGDPPQDQEDLGGPAVGLVEGRPGERVEHPAAAAAAVVQDRGAVPPVDLQAVAARAPGAGQALGVEEINQRFVAGVLVHELGDREVHSSLRCNDPRCARDQPSLTGAASGWDRQSPIAAHEPTWLRPIEATHRPPR